MKRVLIVDDEPDVLVMMRLVLASEGYEPVLAADGATAMRRIAEERADAVLLDVMMPGVDGWEMLRRVHELHGMGSIPVIVFSGQVEGATGEAEARGAQAFLGKGFNPQDLISRTKELLGA